MTPGPLLAMAEQLLPADQPGHLEGPGLGGPRPPARTCPLRELRSIVASASTVTLDDEGTEMATALRTSLTERVTALRERWVERITAALDDGRVVDAVRASIRPPEPAARLSAELAVRLAEAAGQAMTADTPPGRVAGPPRGGGGLAGPPDGQAGRPAHRGRREPCWPRPARRRATCPSWPG